MTGGMGNPACAMRSRAATWAVYRVHAIPDCEWNPARVVPLARTNLPPDPKTCRLADLPGQSGRGFLPHLIFPIRGRASGVGLSGGRRAPKPLLRESRGSGAGQESVKRPTAHRAGWVRPRSTRCCSRHCPQAAIHLPRSRRMVSAVKPERTVNVSATKPGFRVEWYRRWLQSLRSLDVEAAGVVTGKR